MRETVKIQNQIGNAEKEKQVLQSKHESAKSTVAFLEKKNEELTARQSEYKSQISEYQRMIEVEKSRLEDLRKEEKIWLEVIAKAEQYMKYGERFLTKLDEKLCCKMMGEEEKEKQEKGEKEEKIEEPENVTAVKIDNESDQDTSGERKKRFYRFVVCVVLTSAPFLQQRIQRMKEYRTKSRS